MLLASATGTLGALPPLRWRDDAAVTVVIASGGYPGAVRSGDPITGIEDAEAIPGVHVLHAGTALDGAHLVSAGGRVLSVVGTGPDLAAARAAAYAGVAQIELPSRTTAPTSRRRSPTCLSSRRSGGGPRRSARQLVGHRRQPSWRARTG